MATTTLEYTVTLPPANPRRAPQPGTREYGLLASLVASHAAKERLQITNISAFIQDFYRTAPIEAVQIVRSAITDALERHELPRSRIHQNTSSYLASPTGFFDAAPAKRHARIYRNPDTIGISLEGIEVPYD